MKPNLVQRWRLLKAAAKTQRLQRETQNLFDEVREAEGATCGYCRSWRLWKDLVDESTQERGEPLICVKCVKRREIAHGLGWNDWPRTH